ncbi:unnamed protein product [Lampetra fluviatilis]
MKGRPHHLLRKPPPQKHHAAGLATADGATRRAVPLGAASLAPVAFAPRLVRYSQTRRGPSPDEMIAERGAGPAEQKFRKQPPSVARQGPSAHCPVLGMGSTSGGRERSLVGRGNGHLSAFLCTIFSFCSTVPINDHAADPHVACTD